MSTTAPESASTASTELQGYSVDPDERPSNTHADTPVTSPATAITDAAPGTAKPSEIQETSVPAAPIPAAATAVIPETHSIEPEVPRTPENTESVDEFAANPQLASLHAIFPDFDASLLQSVLESVDGNQDRAVDTLLGMSDPEHVSTSIPERTPEASQTELDEQFARQLMLQEQEEYTQRQQRYQQSRGEAWQPQAQGNEASPPLDGYTPPPGQQRDTLAEVQDQFNKIAETGKRTFSSFVSKVKAKVQEFDQSRNQGDQAQAGGSSSSQGSRVLGGSLGQPQSGLDRHQQAAYYAPTEAVEPSPRPPPPGSLSRGSTTASAEVRANDAVTDAPLATTATPAPPRTNSGPPTIDPGSVGLLPKRPVVLLGSNNASATPRSPPDDDDEDELEYVENPFEEGRR